MRDADEESDRLGFLSPGLDTAKIPRIFEPASPRGMYRVLGADGVFPQIVQPVVAMMRNAVEAAKTWATHMRRQSVGPSAAGTGQAKFRELLPSARLDQSAVRALVDPHRASSPR
jgi:hypothetical protein